MNHHATDAAADEGPDPLLDFAQRVAKARHDLRNPLAHIMGFTEILLEHVPKRGYEFMRPLLESLYHQSEELVARINQSLDPNRLKDNPADVAALQRRVLTTATGLLTLSTQLTLQARAVNDEHFVTDLERITGAAQRLGELAEAALPGLLPPSAT